MRLELLSYENTNLLPGWKPYFIYLIMVDHQEVGRIVLREGNSLERYYDGHIGYSIEEKYRGHHYSSCLLYTSDAADDLIGVDIIIVGRPVCCCLILLRKKDLKN